MPLYREDIDRKRNTTLLLLGAVGLIGVGGMRSGIAAGKIRSLIASATQQNSVERLQSAYVTSKAAGRVVDRLGSIVRDQWRKFGASANMLDFSTGVLRDAGALFTTSKEIFKNEQILLAGESVLRTFSQTVDDMFYAQRGRLSKVQKLKFFGGVFDREALLERGYPKHVVDGLFAKAGDSSFHELIMSGDLPSLQKELIKTLGNRTQNVHTDIAHIQNIFKESLDAAENMIQGPIKKAIIAEANTGVYSDKLARTVRRLYGGDALEHITARELKSMNKELYDDVFKGIKGRASDFDDMFVDPLLFKDGDKLIDLRAQGKVLQQSMGLFREHIQVPYFGLNPLDLIGSGSEAVRKGFKPVNMIRPGEAQPQLANLIDGIGYKGRISKPLISVSGYGGGKGAVIDINDPKKVYRGWTPIPSNFAGPGTFVRERFHKQLGEYNSFVRGLENPEVNPKSALNFVERMKSKLDIGAQTDPSVFKRLFSMVKKYDDHRWDWNVLENLKRGAFFHEMQGWKAGDSPEKVVYNIIGNSYRKLSGRLDDVAVMNLKRDLSHIDGGKELIDKYVVPIEKTVSDQGILETLNSLKADKISYEPLAKLVRMVSNNPEALTGNTEVLRSMPAIMHQMLGVQTTQLLKGPQVAKNAIIEHYVTELVRTLRRSGDLSKLQENVGETLRLISDYAKFNRFSYGKFVIGEQAAYRQALSWMSQNPQMIERLQSQTGRLQRMFQTGPMLEPGSLDELAAKTYLRSPKSLGDAGFLGYIKQLFPGGIEDVTRTSEFPHYLITRMGRQIGFYGAGLSEKSLTSPQAAIKNIAMKRIAPVVLGATAFAYGSYLMGEMSDDYLRPSSMFRRSYSNYLMDVARIKDFTGLSGMGRWAEETLAGWDQVAGSPPGMVLGALGFAAHGRTAEEQREYIAQGTSEVRRGRYWFLSSTPWTGQQVVAEIPNWFTQSRERYKFTKEGYGSEDDYWKNHWMPTPTSPLAPIRRFLIDPYRWEREHYYSRPFPYSGELVSPNITGAALINQTVGRLIKPVVPMHQTEMAARRGGDNVSIIAAMNQEVKSRAAGPAQQHPLGLLGGSAGSYFDRAMQPMAVGRTAMLPRIGGGGGGAGGPVMSTGYAPGVTATGQRYMPAHGGMVMQTGGGIRSEGMHLLSMMNEDVHNRALIPKSRFGAHPLEVSGQGPLNIERTGYDLFMQVEDILGFYGFSIGHGLFRTGDTKRAKRMETAARGYGAERGFYELEIGGIGGPISEIGRRFMPHEERTIEQVNPLRNLMPTWMPGQGGADPTYFKDFLHGDPYNSIQFGMLRLPSEAYEKTHDVKVYNPLRASMLGKPQGDQLQYLLNMNEASSYSQEKIMERGTEVHNMLARKWEEMGALVAAEVPVYDRKNEIYGHLDSLLIGPGGSMVPIEVKTKSSRTLRELVQPEEPHISQLNFYLHALGQKEGYIYYAARDDVSAHKAFKVARDDTRLAKDVADFQMARSTADKLSEMGMVNRFEHYSDLDKLRILGETAPFSSQYKYYRNKMLFSGEDPELSHGILTAEAMREEARKIDDKVQERKKRLRTTEYKFLGRKDALKNEQVDPETGQVTGESYGFLSRLIGAGWERIVHMDNPIFTKFLHVRSSIEQYERSSVYGKERRDWAHPIRDFVTPTAKSFIGKNPLVAAIAGGIGTSMFFKKEGPKVLAAAIGSIAFGTIAAGRTAADVMTGTRWVPEETRKRWQVEEYFDYLKYVKYMGLYSKASDIAGGRERVDEQEKTERGMLEPMVAQALYYKQQASNTLYAASSDSTAALYASAPKEMKQYIDSFLDARPKDRERLYKILPPNVRRFFAHEWWGRIGSFDNPESALSYFSRHQLPDKEWAGWRPDVNLDEYKVKVLMSEGIDAADAGEYVKPEADDRTLAWDHGVGIGHLRNLLRGAGLKDIDIRMDVLDDQETSSVDVSFDLARDRTGEVLNYIQKRGF